jgi:hypothetical protein
MAARRLVRWTVAGAGLGALAAAVVLAGLRVHGNAPAAQVFACLAFPVGAAILALVRRPSLEDAARRADAHFGLDDRLTTALEYRASTEPLVVRQRNQTAAAVAGKSLRAGAGSWVAPRELAGAFVALLAAVILVAVPAPSASHASATSSAELARIRKLAAQEIPALARSLPPSNVRASQEAHQVLAHLQAELKRARTKADALRAISVAERRLARIAASIKPVDQSSASALAKTLSSYIPESRGPASLKAARALTNISRRLRHATPAQKARMASDLLKAANAAHDARTRSLLRKAASAVGYGDKRRAQSTLRKASRSLRQSSSARKVQGSLSKTARKLDSAKYNLSPSRLGKLQGAALSTDQSKVRHDSANGAAPSRGSNLNRRIVNRNSAASGLNGKRNVSESGQPSDSGGYSLGKQQDAAGNGSPKRFGVVYLQGKLSKGTYNVQTGPNGQVQHLSPSQYRLVLAQYARSAEGAVSRTALPPSLRTYVRRYFVVLTHP